MAFKHCRPVISVDGKFLTGQFKGTLLVAKAHDANDRLVPLAFALVTTENNDNWEWFMNLVRTKCIEAQREVCVISDRHQGILNAVEIEIPGHARVHHRWCMRHFVSNFYRACNSKELSDDLKDCCLAFTERHFARLYNRLLTLTTSAGGQEFLHRHESQVHKWARAFDEGGRRYGDMTSNMAECFNNVIKGVRALPVTAIVQYTFDKLNVYFQKYSEETDDQIAGKTITNKKYKYPPEVDKWVSHQSRKSESQTAQCFDNDEWIYQVNEPGGTTVGGVQHGGRACKVMLKKGECSCQRPQLLHLPCSHLRTAGRIRKVKVKEVGPVRVSEYSIEATKHTWASRFHPYFDQSQWPEYHGIQVWPDLDLKVNTRGRRKTKRFRNDMDAWGAGGLREWGSQHFQEPRASARCGGCNGDGHNTRGCSRRKRKKGNEGGSRQGGSQEGGS